MKVLIIDDEPKAITVMKTLLERSDYRFDTVYAANGVEEALELLQDKSFDFLFLDIHMNDGSGFDVLERCVEVKWKYLVFTTAYDEYALKAIKFSASDYLLKPLGLLELDEAITRCLSRQVVYRNSQELIHTLVSKNYESLTLPTCAGFQNFRLDEVLFVHADANYSLFHFETEKTLLVARTLRYYEELLVEHAFIRTHRSYLVNTAKIKSIPKAPQGEIVLNSGVKIPVSRRKMQDVRRLFDQVRCSVVRG